jgi:hypothetical protein
MATMEMPVIEELEGVAPTADFSARFEAEPNPAVPLEPWKQTSNSGTPAEIDWLFETLMA